MECFCSAVLGFHNGCKGSAEAKEPGLADAGSAPKQFCMVHIIRSLSFQPVSPSTSQLSVVQRLPAEAGIFILS